MLIIVALKSFNVSYKSSHYIFSESPRQHSFINVYRRIYLFYFIFYFIFYFFAEEFNEHFVKFPKYALSPEMMVSVITGTQMGS